MARSKYFERTSRFSPEGLSAYAYYGVIEPRFRWPVSHASGKIEPCFRSESHPFEMALDHTLLLDCNSFTFTHWLLTVNEDCVWIVDYPVKDSVSQRTFTNFTVPAGRGFWQSKRATKHASTVGVFWCQPWRQTICTVYRLFTIRWELRIQPRYSNPGISYILLHSFLSPPF